MAKSVYKSKRDVVIEAVREAILSGELEPGERLLQDDLAERLNVSSTPVREALRQLEAEGVLQHSPHKGVRVAEVKLDDVREIYLIRGVVDTLATRLGVPHLDTSDIQRLKALNAQMEALIERGQRRECRLPNYEFHLLIYKAAGMPQLLQIIRNLWTKLPVDTLGILPGRADKVLEEHQALIQAIENRNAELAGQRMQEHIGRSAMALTEYLATRT